jgi:hypothetical protein
VCECVNLPRAFWCSVALNGKKALHSTHVSDIYFTLVAAPALPTRPLTFRTPLFSCLSVARRGLERTLPMPSAPLPLLVLPVVFGLFIPDSPQFSTSSWMLEVIAAEWLIERRVGDAAGDLDDIPWESMSSRSSSSLSL